MENKVFSEDIIADSVRKFWRENHFSQDVIVFFNQKYDWEEEWDWREELIESNAFMDFEDLAFRSDFCEGQTMVKNIFIVPLEEVTRFYARHKLLADCD